MIIKKIYIKSFGTLNNFNTEFSNGLNIIEGPNESGKTTIAMFIKFMFYGLNGRSINDELSEKKKYTSWDTHEAAGTLTLENENGVFRIERIQTMSQKSATKENYQDLVKIYNVATNQEVYKGLSPADVFIGLNENVFTNTIFVKQLAPTKIDENEVKSAIENILDSADENVDSKKALKSLEDQRKLLLYKNENGGKIYELKNSIEDLQLELANSQKSETDRTNYEDELVTIRDSIDNFNKELKEANANCEIYKLLRKAETISKQEELQKDLNKVSSDLENYSSSPASYEYINNINQTVHEIKRATAEVNLHKDSLKSQNEKLNKINYELQSIDDEGSFVNNLHKLTSKIKNSRFLGILLCIIGCISFVVLHDVAKLECPIALIIALVFFALSITSIVICIISKNKLNKILAPLDCNNDTSVAITEFNNIIKEKENLNESLKDSEKKIDIAQKVIDSQNELLYNMCKPFIDKESKDSLNIIVNDTIEKCENIIKAKEALQSQKAIINGRLLEINSQLKDINVDDVIGKINIMPKELKNRFKGYKDSDYERFKDKKRICEGLIEEKKERKIEIEKQLSYIKGKFRSASDIVVDLESAKEELVKFEALYESYKLAIDTINQATENIRLSLMPKISKKSSDLVSKISSGKYNNISLGDSLEMTFNADGFTRELDYLSAGTKDVAYLSLRIALATELFKDGNPIAIFDESFARIDENRVQELLSLLSNTNDVQSLVFSCRTLEGKISRSLSNTTTLSI